MAITVVETYDSRDVVADRSATLKFIISGTEYFSEKDAVLYLQANTSTTYSFGLGSIVTSTLVRQPVQVEPIGDPTVTFKYRGVVTYAINKNNGPEDPIEIESFNTTGGTAKIKQSLDTVDQAGDFSDYDNAINVSNNGGNLSVDGVDIVIPVYSFSINKYFEADDVDTAYKGDLFELTGRVNNATFKGLLAGECLFLGANGNQQSNGDWQITFNFSGSPNETNFAVNPSAGSAALTVDKKGWEYLWVEYKEQKDETSKKLKKVVSAAYVEKVYKTGDFSKLGLD